MTTGKNTPEDNHPLNTYVDLAHHPKVQGLGSSSSLSFLQSIFKAMIQYSLAAGKQADETEMILHSMGLRLGYKILDLIKAREHGLKHDVGIEAFLTFLCQTAWKYLFASTAELYKCEKVSEWLITDNAWPLAQYVDVPQHLRSTFSVGAYAAGILEGLLAAADYPAVVVAHPVESTTPGENRVLGSYGVTLHIDVLDEVLERQNRIKELGWKHYA